MIDEQRKRAGEAVEMRMRELGLNGHSLARAAQVDDKTIRNLLHGVKWPQLHTRRQVEDALRWPPGEIARRALHEEGLEAYTVTELWAELERRLRAAGCL